MRKIVQMIMSMAVIASLLAGASEFTCLASEAVGMEDVGDFPEVLDAIVLENVEWSANIIPYTSLAQCIISVSGSDEGMLIDITTGSVGRASVIGVKDIEIQQKVWYGWKTVAVCSGGESYNHSMMGISILYDNAVKDETYRITCVHYGDVDGYMEGTNDTGAFVYTY